MEVYLKFSKDALSAEEQLNLLISRGLLIEDYQSALEIIKRIGYYHLSAYMRLFQLDSEHRFAQNTEFMDIINLYKFDTELRHITFNAIEKIEIAYRAAISNIMCKIYGSNWFENQNAFLNETQQEVVIQIIKDEIKKKNKKENEYAETFISKYYEKYSEPQLPPFWMTAETFSLGSLNRVLFSLKFQYKKQIAEYLGFKADAKFIANSKWLQAICVIRNICAHHSRLFNRILRIRPKKHNGISEFNDATTDKYYYIAIILDYYLKTILKDNSFETQIINLFNKYPQINKALLGFPKDWKNFSITYIFHKKIRQPN